MTRHPAFAFAFALAAVYASLRAEPAYATEPQRLRDGALLYATHCATCHAADLRGSPNGPALRHAGGAAVDFYLTTGRMPLSVPGTQADHGPAQFDERQIAALDAYVGERAAQTTPIPAVRLRSALLQRGRKLYESNCQACHGAGAQGATAGRQWTALALEAATPRQIGEAIRVGPGVMPRFGTGAFSARDVDAVATYVRYLVTSPQTYGGATMDYLGPVAEGFIGAFLGVGTLFLVVYYTGTKADGRRLHERD